MTMISGRVSLVVLTHSCETTLADRVEMLSALPLADAEIIVIGDDVDAAPVAHLQTTHVRSAGPDRRVQRDLGARLSTGEVIVFLAPGTMLSADLVDDLTDRYGSDKREAFDPEVCYQFQH